MADYKVLVPFNLAVDDDRTLDFVVHLFSKRKEALITLFYACNPVSELQVQNNPIMEKMAGNIAYRRQMLRDQEKALEAAGERLTNKGFKFDRVNTLFRPLKKDVPSDIVRLIRDKGFDAVVLTRNPGRIAGFFTRSVSAKVSRNISSDVQLFFVN
ncbi:MAG: universal stress protein [Desulfobacteraceae bacterium]